MNERHYIIGSGYHNTHGARGDALAWFFRLWMENNKKYANPLAYYVVQSGDGKVPDPAWYKTVPVHWLPLHGNLGYFGQLLSGQKPYHFSGCAAMIAITSMIAYANECDYIYKEQDTLAFGPWVDRMYSEIGSHGCIFGSCRTMGQHLSPMLIRHAFIPEFVRIYLGSGRENDAHQTMEAKLGRFEQAYPSDFCRYSFGYDRDRPLNLNDPVFCAQKISREELRSMSAAGLLDLTGMPDTVQEFTNFETPKP